MKRKVVVLLLFMLFFVSILAFVNSQKSLTKTDAENIVRELPEVRDKLNSSSGWVIYAEDRNKGFWYVQVAEIVNDTSEGYLESSGHTATFNWYKIDKKNKQIVCSMFNYDAKGVLQEQTEPTSCN